MWRRRPEANIDTSLPKLDQFLSTVSEAFAAERMVRLALRAHTGGDATLKSIDARPALIKQQRQLSFTWHYKTRDIVKNLPIADALELVKGLLDAEFRLAQLFTTDADIALDLQGKAPRLKQSAASETEAPSLGHDRQKTRALPAAGRAWMQALGISDAKGAVLATAQDKFRQINRYVEILGPLLKDIAPQRLRKIVDMGAGKGYLTFAVADYLKSTLHSEAEVVGVELRRSLVDLGNETARSAGLDHLSFAEGAIADFDAADASVLIALHACDTATDDAIAKGIAAKSELIVVAPCCHKQVRREIEKAKVHSPLDFLMRHGIFVERQAEMLTDSIRALVLEHFGYRTKVFEFVSDVHTPKNVLIVATRGGGRNATALDQIASAKAMFGIGRHYLEDATGL